jgi:hypothetical protein
MTNKTLDRISLGHFENKEGLEKKGKVSFKLYVSRNEGPYWPNNQYFDFYSIRGYNSNGEKIWGQHTGENKLVDKQTFLKQLNEDLAQMNGYLAEAKYSKRFPAFWMHKIKGVLYQEKKE